MTRENSSLQLNDEGYFLSRPYVFVAVTQIFT